MKKLDRSEYGNYIRSIDRTSRGAVYPLSMAGLTQPGDIYAGQNAVLFWHYCGFAFIYGEYDSAFLDEVYETFLSWDSILPRRFVLFADEERVKRYFLEKDNILSDRRLFFEYRKDAPERRPELPEGMSLCGIDEETIGKIEGRNIPGFSWDDMTEFLRRGKGFCVLDGSRKAAYRVAAWAFSAAVSDEEIDVGVETAPDYRRRGLGATVVNEMIRYILRQGKRPVWSCRSENEGSRRLAEASGFVMTGDCLTVRKQ